MIVVACLLGCAHSSPPSAGAPRVDPAARMFALRAWRAEARGDAAQAERAWRWVVRLDGGFWSALHQAEALQRMGLDPKPSYRGALGFDPLSQRAQLGLALASELPVERFLPRFACRIAGSNHPDRVLGEALCVR